MTGTLIRTLRGVASGDLVATLSAPRPEAGSKRPAALVGVWLLVLVAAMALVVYGFGPYFQDREQRRLLSRYRTLTSQAEAQASGLSLSTTVAKAPEDGSPVGILEIGGISIQQVVVEGVGSTDTRKGPGHVPGTAGLGQPGNSVVVGRRTAFGGPFSALRSVAVGDQILVSTVQGQSVYRATSVTKVTITTDTGESDGSTPTAPTDFRTESAGSTGTAVSIDELYGPTAGDQLTLVTSASRRPWNDSRATVVVAELQTAPFAPTPQAGRSNAATGLTSDEGFQSSVILALLVHGLILGACVLLYQRFSTRTAYILSLAPIVAITIATAETVSRGFPAWM